MAVFKVKIDPNDQQAYAELLGFMTDFTGLLNKHIESVRNILLVTVTQAMEGVTSIDHAVQKCVDCADTSRSFDDVSRFSEFNKILAEQKHEIIKLDSEIHCALQEIIGALSVDDVIRQRLEHLSTSVIALNDGLQKLIKHYGAGNSVSIEFYKALEQEILLKMFRSFTMEDEKQTFQRVFGLVDGINQKSL